MNLDVAGVLADAWRMWKRDRDLLLAVAGFFLFLPQFAVLVLLPDPPVPAAGVSNEEAIRVWAPLMAQWLSDYGLALVGSILWAAFGALLIFVLYLRSGRPDLKNALQAASRLLLRYLLVSVLASLPIALIAVPAVGFLLIIPGIYAIGRMMLAGAAMVAEQPLGAVASVKRSIELSRGHGLAFAGIAIALLLGSRLLPEPFVALGRVLDGAPTANPVSAALLDAMAAATASLATLATILIQIALYRRLVASKGI
ncbi:hypothetical protein GCM10009087_34410 [Sphingomonas oligophenolica]|uniref:Glycerophosphoryl diester phosphodiesterase membrane domain-containing protein n=1 Tax=Sphingomonas oligophenolica TaxID=301154 RepID=A0ABU9XYY1_9SPHN